MRDLNKFMGGALNEKLEQALLALTANVVDESVKTYGDDGVSQQATVKSGVTSVASVKVPNPVTLKPLSLIHI